MQSRATLLLFLAVATVLLQACGPDDGRSHDRAKINLCWEDQGKRSLPPDQARFIASVCERLEAEFLQKYGTKP